MFINGCNKQEINMDVIKQRIEKSGGIYFDQIEQDGLPKSLLDVNFLS